VNRAYGPHHRRFVALQQREKAPDLMVFKVGTLDDASGLKLARNIWIDSALPWMHVDPALEIFPASRPLKV
jgi:hypothetical protein